MEFAFQTKLSESLLSSGECRNIAHRAIPPHFDQKDRFRRSFYFYPARSYALLHFGANGDIMVLLLRTEAFDNENNQTFGSLACGVHNVMLHRL
jgi:hypothetical protein